MWQDCFICLILTTWSIDCRNLPPVILVPGNGGSRIEAKLNKSSNQWPHCDTLTKDFYTIWVHLESVLTPTTTGCFIENFKLIYNNKTHTTRYSDGVQIRIPKFGDTDAVEYLNHIKIGRLGYYDKMVEKMVKWGYVRNKTVRGAPYDFRRSPNELNEFYKNLTMLIEDTYSINNHTKVVLIAHSLGNLVVLYFLNHQTQEWKDKYISSLITLGAPWGGSVKALKMLISGDDVDILTVKALQARSLQRSMTSSYFLMPSSYFWNKSEVLIQSPKRNYTVNDYKQLLVDLNFTDGILMRGDTEKLINPINPPNVVVHCLYGYGLKTIAGCKYDKDTWPDHHPELVYGDGDHTVTIRSLQGCLQWQNLQKHPVHHEAFKGIGHMDILKHGTVIEYIRNILMT